MRRGWGWWDLAALAHFASWRETGFVITKTPEQSENVYENKGRVKKSAMYSSGFFAPLSRRLRLGASNGSGQGCSEGSGGEIPLGPQRGVGGGGEIACREGKARLGKRA